MKICLIGDGISTLLLAKVLANRNINVSIYLEHQSKKKLTTRTLGISKNSFEFLINEKINIKKKSWPIKKIKIFNEIENKKEILNFGYKNEKIFYIIKHVDLVHLLNICVKKNKLIKKHKIKNSSFFKSILNEKDNYNLVINFNENNLISKKLFFKRNEKEYNSFAYTSLLTHASCNNNTAHQIFTKFGPLAFLPNSNSKTSIVFSVLDKNNIMRENKIKDLISNYNKNYKIKYFSEFEKFKLKSSILKNYYYKKILCFGDNLHKIHPLAGQGLNMTIRDIKVLLSLIDFRISIGLPIDNSILLEFQNKTKHYNYIFANTIDFIHEFFRFDNSFKNRYSKKLFSFLETNNLFKKYTTKFADKGIFF